MRIAITGGSGRVGRAVIALARAQGHTITSLDRVAPPDDTPHDEGVTHMLAEVTDYTAFEAALNGCDALVHLAAIPSPNGHPDFEVHNNNVVGSYNALSLAAKLGINRVCQASSINAIGGAYSRWPRYDYFPVDEQHPNYAEDAYSLSKWICEQQADAFARRYEAMTIASLRLHGVARDREAARSWRQDPHKIRPKHLWGYTTIDAVARACLLSLSADFVGHEVFYIVAPDTMMETASLELREEFFPEVPVRGDLSGHRSFYDSSKAERMLGWLHDLD